MSSSGEKRGAAKAAETVKVEVAWPDDGRGPRASGCHYEHCRVERYWQEASFDMGTKQKVEKVYNFNMANARKEFKEYGGPALGTRAASLEGRPEAMPVIYTRLRFKPTFQLSSSSNSGKEDEFALGHEDSEGNNI
ncbi:hypothetical protein CB1_001111008 [Camelus ferus]|nr:hypothetical protein CB1_001111008 [Camelus ferus]